ncbi:MAG: aminoglycoside phosphotransferase family protein [Methanobacteriota archaeon]
MESDAMMMDHIRKYIEFSEIIPISKGYSIDQKYLLIAAHGEKYLVRVTESDDFRVLTAKRDQFGLIRELRQYSSLVPEAYHFWISDSVTSCVMILEYIDGDDGEESLNSLSRENQYEIGYQAGEELKKLHHLAAPPETPPWHLQKQRKYKWYCNSFQQMPPELAEVDPGVIDAVIKKYLHHMKDTSQTFQHDDYHPANLIIRNGRMSGIIDFNRCDWGDPIHDFYKVAYFTRSISIPFAKGQIDGYYQGSVPPDFWERYILYCAMSIIPDLVWSGRYADRTGSQSELEKSIQRIRIIYEDHNGFSSTIPRWYTKR